MGLSGTTFSLFFKSEGRENGGLDQWGTKGKNQPDLVKLSCALTLQPLLFWRKKNKGKTPKKQGFFSSRNPENPWRTKENAQKKKTRKIKKTIKARNKKKNKDWRVRVGQKNPRAHKNKIGTPPPPKKPKIPPPPLKGGILWTWVSCRKNAFFRGAHKTGGLISPIFRGRPKSVLFLFFLFRAGGPKSPF